MRKNQQNAVLLGERILLETFIFPVYLNYINKLFNQLTIKYIATIITVIYQLILYTYIRMYIYIVYLIVIHRGGKNCFFVTIPITSSHPRIF